jgi:hypothetical protein
MADDATRGSEFSLSGGGPIYSLMKAVGLFPAARAAIALSLLAFVPLVVLAFLQGVAFGDSVRLPLLYDVSVYARLLVAIPMFILIGPLVDRLLELAMRSFADTGMMSPSCRADYDAAVRALNRGREARTPELVIIVGALLIIWLGSQRGLHSEVASWITPGPRGAPLTWAGIWFGVFGLPLFLVLAGRWGWRIFLWGRFLWRVSKLDLELVPSHPDMFGGLGVLPKANASLGLVIVPLSVTLAANAVNRVQLQGESLSDMKIALGVYVVLALLVTQGPLLAFSGPLRRAKFKGLLAYGLLAERYSRDFDRRWLPKLHPHVEPEPHPKEAPPLLGSADIQSLADMGNSFTQVTQMRLALLEPRTLGVVAGMAIVPMLPLLALVIPLQDAVATLAKLLLR